MGERLVKIRWDQYQLAKLDKLLFPYTTQHKPTIDNRLLEGHSNEELKDDHPTATHSPT